jgi:hypothetical protein
LGKSEFKTAGAASPRIDSGTYENLSLWFARPEFVNCG